VSQLGDCRTKKGILKNISGNFRLKTCANFRRQRGDYKKGIEGNMPIGKTEVGEGGPKKGRRG